MLYTFRIGDDITGLLDSLNLKKLDVSLDVDGRLHHKNKCGSIYIKYEIDIASYDGASPTIKAEMHPPGMTLEDAIPPIIPEYIGIHLTGNTKNASKVLKTIVKTASKNGYSIREHLVCADYMTITLKRSLLGKGPNGKIELSPAPEGDISKIIKGTSTGIQATIDVDITDENSLTSIVEELSQKYECIGTPVEIITSRFDHRQTTGGKEEEFLGRYIAVLEAARSYAKKKRLKITEDDWGNIYRDMCEKQIGNFNYGQRRRIIAKNTEGTQVFSLKTSLQVDNESHNLDGDFKITADGPLELIKILKETMKKAKPIPVEDIEETREKMREGYQMCYGLCKRD